MPRPLLLEYPGALYHVMARGDGGRRVFESKEDARALLGAHSVCPLAREWSLEFH